MMNDGVDAGDVEKEIQVSSRSSEVFYFQNPV